MIGLSCHCGVIWSGRQPGQVGQEAPDPVAHTTAPIATARKTNNAARRKTVSTAVGGSAVGGSAVGGAESFLGMEISPGCHDGGRQVPARHPTQCDGPVSYTHLRAHETDSYLVCRLLLEKKKKNQTFPQ